MNIFISFSGVAREEYALKFLNLFTDISECANMLKNI